MYVSVINVYKQSFQSSGNNVSKTTTVTAVDAPDLEVDAVVVEEHKVVEEEEEKAL